MKSAGKGIHALTPTELKELLSVLKGRFTHHINRHKKIEWTSVEQKLKSNPGKAWSVYEMNRTGGEPDVIGHDNKTDEFIICDCSAETPSGRRNLCYDREALDKRKENKPMGNAVEMATEMGVQLLTEKQYRELQSLGDFDLKTSSWIDTPASIRKLGGALFCDRRFDNVFVYHNGASSYYAARGFRAIIRL